MFQAASRTDRSQIGGRNPAPPSPTNHVVLAALLVTALSCTDPGAPVADTAIRTDRSSYRLQASEVAWQIEIQFTYTNSSGEPLYVPNCNGQAPPVLEKLVDEDRIIAWTPVVPACLSPPIIIPAHGSYEGNVFVLAGFPDNQIVPKFEVQEIPGTYRLLWPDVLVSYDESRYPFGDPLPKERAVSNRFTLTF